MNQDILNEIEDLLSGDTQWDRDDLLDNIQMIIDKYL
jgi:hypothetical protein